MYLGFERVEEGFGCWSSNYLLHPFRYQSHYHQQFQFQFHYLYHNNYNFGRFPCSTWLMKNAFHVSCSISFFSASSVNDPNGTV